VLYAPRLTRIEDIRSVVESVDRPVNVLAWTGLPPVYELAAAGVSRISVGGWFAFSALNALVQAATELRERGTYGYIDAARGGAAAAASAFAGDS
jgi:2-methylisocitrate lyase-like PEP mutase family enzyme